MQVRGLPSFFQIVPRMRHADAGDHRQLSMIGTAMTNIATVPTTLETMLDAAIDSVQTLVVIQSAGDLDKVYARTAAQVTARGLVVIEAENDMSDDDFEGFYADVFLDDSRTVAVLVRDLDGFIAVERNRGVITELSGRTNVLIGFTSTATLATAFELSDVTEVDDVLISMGPRPYGSKPGFGGIDFGGTSGLPNFAEVLAGLFYF